MRDLAATAARKGAKTGSRKQIRTCLAWGIPANFGIRDLEFDRHCPKRLARNLPLKSRMGARAVGHLTKQPSTAAEAAANPLDAAIRASVLVVEPEALLRWSLVTYLSRCFRVFPADSVPAAEQILRSQQVDAMVLSDELGSRPCDELDQELRKRNPGARVVRVITSPGEGSIEDSTCLEKPFELAQLLTLLKTRTPAA